MSVQKVISLKDFHSRRSLHSQDSPREGQQPGPKPGARDLEEFRNKKGEPNPLRQKKTQDYVKTAKTLSN